MASRSSPAAITLYFLAVIILATFLFLNAFKVIELETGFFTRFVLSLLVVALLLPLIPKIKIFEVIDIKRDTKMFSAKKK
jgi:hypothetical protein